MVNCQRLVCKLGRPIRFCNEKCHRYRPEDGNVKHNECEDCQNYISKILELQQKISEQNITIGELQKVAYQVTAEKIPNDIYGDHPNEDKPNPEHPAEETPRRKYNKKR